MKFLEESVKFIEQKDELEAKIRDQNNLKKAVAKDLPKILGEIKTLKEEIDELKKLQDNKVSNLEDCDK